MLRGLLLPASSRPPVVDNPAPLPRTVCDKPDSGPSRLQPATADGAPPALLAQLPRRPPGPPRTPPSRPIAAPTHHTVGTQTDPADFTAVPADAAAVAAASAVPATAAPSRPEALSPGRAFRQELREAQRTFGAAVSFNPVHDGERLIGYALSARKPLPHIARGTAPALFVAGSSSIRSQQGEFRTRTGISAVAGDAGSTETTEYARELRRGRPEPANARDYPAGSAGVPNFRVGSRTMTPMKAAEFVSNAGRSAQHSKPVDMFVAVPGMEVNLSTVVRALQGAYSGMVYARY